MKNKFEMGGSLLDKHIKLAKAWFDESGAVVPKGSVAWRKSSVRRGEIPPGMSQMSLFKLGIKVPELIKGITGDSSIKSYVHDPITKDNILQRLGFHWVSSFEQSGHKKVSVKCDKCSREESLDYGTLQRMFKSNNVFCRYCRNSGGKEKELSEYCRFDNFKAVAKCGGIISYKCEVCSSIINRGISHSKTAEYLVCEICNPNIIIGSKINTEYGRFSSTIEYEAYKILLQYFDIADIELQKSYNELFDTNTKHTADFYIKSVDLVLEVTTKSNNIGHKYNDTMKWKQSLSSKVVFAYSLKQVDDIVRPLAKA